MSRVRAEAWGHGWVPTEKRYSPHTLGECCRSLLCGRACLGWVWIPLALGEYVHWVAKLSKLLLGVSNPQLAL